MSDSLYERNSESLARLAQAIRGGMDVMKSEDSLDYRLPLSIAAMKGNADACRMLLEAGADPDRGRAWVDGKSPLCELICSFSGRRDIVGIEVPSVPLTMEDVRAVLRVLIEHGASIDGSPAPVNKYRAMSQSALHVAVWLQSHEAVALLAEFGADMNIQALVPEAGGVPKSALGRAEFSKDQDMMVTLLRHGADDTFLGSPYKGIPPFIGCVKTGLSRVVEYYIKERGEDLGQRHDGRTLLQTATQAETRALIKSIKTEMAVVGAINIANEGGPAGAAGSIISHSGNNKISGMQPL